MPQFWLLTKRAQSRIFQHIAVPDILKKVLTGLDVDLQIMGTFQPRNYCVQYRETDFNFASRLMEEEGIYYFFTHTADGHKMIVANTPQSHLDMPWKSTLTFEKVMGGAPKDDRILAWEKAQELVSGKYTLRDHTFELPHDPLETNRPLQDAAAVGKVNHKLKLGIEERLEIYDYPGDYAVRFDGVNAGGGEQPAEVQKIFQDNGRTIAIRSQQDAAASVSIRGSSACRNLVSGHKFTLDKHGHGDGEYVITSLRHVTSVVADYRSSSSGEFLYTNHFACLPSAIPYRPQRVTPKPFVQGTQTAVVVGPAGKEEIFCDKYGRVKVQFHWDREGKKDASSSCWIRVATAWAGKGWGQINIPRIGHEVVVAFQEGDPDHPIIVGSVYNAENMPSKKLPEGKKTSGLVTRTNESSGGGYNQMTCDDTKEKEMIIIHGQKDMSTTIEHDDTQTINNDRTIAVHGKHTETIDKDTTIRITSGKYVHDVESNTADYHVEGKLTEVYDNDQDTTVALNIFLRSTKGTIREEAEAGEFYVFASKKVEVKSGTDEVHIYAAKKIKLVTGGSLLQMESDGTITISGAKITITGGQQTKIGVSSQNVTCDPSKVAVSGAAINSSAVGMHEITGAVVKIN